LCYLSIAYRKSLKAATRTAAKAPVVSCCWTGATAALDLAVVLEDLVAVAEVDATEALVEVGAAEGVEEETLATASRAVAFFVPHCSAALQFVWPVKSLGWFKIHWE
jgi:hypothetical protein